MKSKAKYSTILLITLILAACGTTATNAQSSNEATQHSIEYKLAVLDGHYTPSNKIKRKYGRALDLLERYCPESRERIGDMALVGRKELRKRNIDESILKILRNYRASIPQEAKPGELGKCSEIFTAYLTNRINSNY